MRTQKLYPWQEQLFQSDWQVPERKVWLFVSGMKPEQEV